MSTVPQELNWVEKRAACTVAEVFNQLCDEIESDVTAANSARQLSEDDQFVATRSGGGPVIIVGRPRRVPNPRVFVALADNRIEVTTERNDKWSATVGLNDEGRCTLRLADGKTEITEVEQWQFRRRALESLFFGS
jgi:hypothetical protein